MIKFKFNPFTGALDMLGVGGGGGGAVDSVNGKTGVVVINPTDIGLGNVSNTSDANKPVSSAQAIAIDTKQDEITSDNNRPLYRDNLGVITGNPTTTIDTTFGGNFQELTPTPNNNLYASLNNVNVRIRPLQDSNSEVYGVYQFDVRLDDNSSGFSQGVGGESVSLLSSGIHHNGTGNTGSVNFIKNYIGLGNGADAIEVGGFSYNYGFGDINANVTINGSMQGYGYQPNINAAATLDPTNSYTQAFFDAAVVNCASSYYTSFSATPNISSILTNKNYTGFNINPTIGELEGDSGVTLLGIYGNYGNIGGWGSNGNFNGIDFRPNVFGAQNATGLSIDMSNVSVYTGAQSILVVQDITLTFIEFKDHDTFTVEYIDDVTAGSENVTIVGEAIQMHIQSGVSTATQVLAAFDANPSLSGAIDVTITGTAGTAQVTQAATNFTGGANAGNKRALNVTGNVRIDGEFETTGNFGIGILNVQSNYIPIDGGGNPTPINQFFMESLPTVSTINSDTVGVAYIFAANVPAGVALTSGPFGIGQSCSYSVALPTVDGSLDFSTCHVAAYNAQGGGGSLGEHRAYRSVGIPGALSLGKYKGFMHHMPFGSPSPSHWGAYVEDSISWFEEGIKIGGSSGSGDTTTHKLEVEGDSLFDGDIGFYGTAPVSQPPSSGAASAGAAYSATEQVMLQEVYDAMRTLGLMS